MSPAMSALTSLGITQNMMVSGILALVVAGVIGLYWQIIVPGAIIILIGSLFINTNDFPKGVDVKKEEVKLFDEHKAFTEDCLNVAMYSKQKCEDLWYQRGEAEVQNSSYKVDKTPESNIQLLDVDNEEYKQRRAEALSKPDAVVLHETYH